MDLRERTSTSGNRHPWETVRSRYFNKKIVKLANNSPVKILDIGSGDCWFAEQLISQLPVGSCITCSDPNFTDEDLTLPSKPGISKFRNLPTDTFDVVIMLDVLEHIEDDVGFLETEVVSRLKSKGHIVISVPAHPNLFTSHDIFLGHFRRYTRRQLFELSDKCFSVDQNGYLFISLALVRLLQRLVALKDSEVESGVGNWTSGNALTKIVNCALFIDTLVSRAFQTFHIRLPGLTVWTIAGAKQSNTSL